MLYFVYRPIKERSYNSRIREVDSHKLHWEFPIFVGWYKFEQRAGWGDGDKGEGRFGSLLLKKEGVREVGEESDERVDREIFEGEPCKR